MDRIKRSQVRFAKLNINNGHIQSGARPVIIVQNDKGNQYCGTVQVVPLTSNTDKAKYPVRVLIENDKCRIKKTSVAMCDQIQTISKSDILDCVCVLPEYYMKKIEKAIKLNLAIV